MKRNVIRDVRQLWDQRDYSGVSLILAVFVIALSCQLLMFWWETR